MSYSSLATYVSISPNHSSRNGYRIDTLTPHYMDGNLSVESCASIFRPTSRRASSNYGIGSDGRIGVYVEEEDRAWTSGSWRNDCRAITFECANLKDGSLTDACWNSLVRLCADICKRYGYNGVYYCGSADYSRLPYGYMLLTKHKWFQDTDCPGPWLTNQFSRLANEVNALMGAADDMKGFNVEKTVTVRSDFLRVRDAPSTKTGKVVMSGDKEVRYAKGDEIDIDSIVIGDDGYAWGSYIGGSSGKRRYVALGMLENAR